MKIVSTTKVLKTDVYHLSPLVHYVKKFENDILIENKLVYVPDPTKKEKHLRVYYNLDLESTKTINPFLRKDINLFFQNKDLPDNPEDVDLTKISLVYLDNHEILDINLNVLPSIFHFDEIDGITNKNYDLKALKLFLDKHENVLNLSEIQDIPHYNRTKKEFEFLSFDVYVADIEILNLKHTKYSILNDYLKISEFKK